MTDPRVLHMFDAAGVAASLVRHGRQRHLPWRYFPRLRERWEKPFRGDFALWAAWRTTEAFRAQVLHVHFGDRARWAQKWPQRPYVLHFHGTDIRELHAMPQFHDAIDEGARGAVAVCYSTPDLAEKTLAVRDDALYVPNPVDIDSLPTWEPTARPRVIFASRWDPSKGLRDQLAIARDLLQRLGPDAEVLGLDWGEGADEARKAGVTLVEPMTREVYVRWLASAHAVVGQSAGVLAISELQAIGIGVPVVMPPPDSGYTDPPVLARPADEVADAVVEVLDDPTAWSRQLGGPEWVREHHRPDIAVDQLRTLYRSIATR